MLTTTMRVCAAAPARVASSRRATAAFRHQASSRPACGAPQLRVPRRAGAVAVRASNGSDARERQLAEAADAAAGLTPAGLTTAALLASPLLLSAQARVAPPRRTLLFCARLRRRLGRCGPRNP